MHSWFVWTIAAMGMTGCLWVLDDIWRFIYLKCVSKYHTVAQQKVDIIRARLLCKCSEMDIDLVFEELSDTTVEVLGPFLD